MSLIPRTAVLFLALAGLPIGAAADGSRPRPVIELTETPFDPATVTWLSPESRAILDPLMKAYADGTGPGYVLAASPSGNWGYRNRDNGGTDVSLEDMVTAALQQCEFYYRAPCRLMAVNGKSARRADGSFAEQPSLLSYGPARFNPPDVPFMNEKERVSLWGYKALAAPKALAMTETGLWSYSGGATLEEAMQKAKESCQAAGPQGTSCFYYAINDIVVLDPLPR